MKVEVISFTYTGSQCNARIVHALEEAGCEVSGYGAASLAERCDLRPLKVPVSVWTGEAFSSCDALIFVGAAGIAVRSIAPYVRDKFTDPAVLVVDELGQYIIPILSGHVGGANGLAKELAGYLGATAVLTTATDIQNKFAVDVFASKNNLLLTDRNKAKKISADILNGIEISVFVGAGLSDGWQKDLPEGLSAAERREDSRIVIDYMRMDDYARALHLIPRQLLWLGIGCKKNTPAEAIEEAAAEFMEVHRLCPEAVAGMASIDLKSDEAGIHEICRRRQWPFYTFSAECLRQIKGSHASSPFVLQQTGVDNVCERAALCAAGDGGSLIVQKQLWPGITLAAASMDRRLCFE